MTIKNSIYGHRPPRRVPQSLGAIKSDSDICEIQNQSNDNIRVVVRVRPENQREVSSGNKHRSIIRIMGEHVLVFDPKDDDPTVEFYRNKPRTGRDIMVKPKRDMKFAFDRVFDDQCTNDIVYDHTAQFVVDGVLNGYNCSVFAYGATGAGKTYTMAGDPENPGVMYQTMNDLYGRIENLKDEKIFEVTVAYFEVYNETVRDLLSISHNQTLPVREDATRGVQIVGLSYHKPDSMEHVMSLLIDGNRNRTQHPTDANAESSRSHAVFQIFIRQRDRTADTHVEHRIAKMSLIDLAGSERATVTKNLGTRFREGANINRSLLALGNVINALADGKMKSQHIPYRDSKLTRILKDSLGGNCRTVMIANISPSSLSFDDTYNTLKYADRAKHIKANVKSNVVSVDFHVHRYQKIIDDLRQEIAELKRDKDDVFRTVAATPRVSSTGLPMQEEIKRYKAVISSVFSSRLHIRRDLMELEGSERDLSLKLHLKQMCLSRVPLVVMDLSVREKNAEKLQRVIKSNANSLEGVVKKKLPLAKKMEENESWLKRVTAEIDKTSGKSIEFEEALEETVSFKHVEVELSDTKRHVAHLKKVARAQERQIQNDGNLIKELLRVVKRQFLLLKATDQLDSTYTDDFRLIESLVCGRSREVVWADATSQVDKTDNFDLEAVLNLPVVQAPETGERRSSSTSTILTPSRRLTKVHQTRDSFSSPSLPTNRTPYDKTPASEDNGNRTCFAGRTPMAKPVVHPGSGTENRSRNDDSFVSKSGSITDLISSSDERLRKGDSVESCVADAIAITGVTTDVIVKSKQITSVGINAAPGDNKVNCPDSICPDATYNIQTLIKNSPKESISGLQTDLLPGVGQTVTKLPIMKIASAGFDNVLGTPISGGKQGIVRAMDFSGPMSPGAMSYADAVKSPPSLTTGMQKGNSKGLDSLLSPASGIQPLPITPELSSRKFTCSDTELLSTPKFNLDELYQSHSEENTLSSGGLARRVKSPRTTLQPPVRVPLKDTNSKNNQGNQVQNDTEEKWTLVSPKKTFVAKKQRDSGGSSNNLNVSQQRYRGQSGSTNGRSSIYQSRNAKQQKNLEVLKRAGLPSMLENSASGAIPGYMRLTTSSRQRAHDRSQTAKENEFPATTDHRVARKSLKVRTQSVPTGPQRVLRPAWQ